MPLEREVKLRFGSAAEARARVLALGATPLRSPRLQQDALLDTADRALMAQQSALRLRREAGQCVVTFKGPPQPATMKLREEVETTAGDQAAMLAILERLGFRVWFRYEKVREEFTMAGVVIAIDDTPIGTFVEIEGEEARIAATADALGRSPADYITSSYRALFVEHCAATGLAADAMTFAEPPVP